MVFGDLRYVHVKLGGRAAAVVARLHASAFRRTCIFEAILSIHALPRLKGHGLVMLAAG
jgi:hypothetical protein